MLPVVAVSVVQSQVHGQLCVRVVQWYSGAIFPVLQQLCIIKRRIYDMAYSDLLTNINHSRCDGLAVGHELFIPSFLVTSKREEHNISCLFLTIYYNNQGMVNVKYILYPFKYLLLKVKMKYFTIQL